MERRAPGLEHIKIQNIKNVIEYNSNILVEYCDLGLYNAHVVNIIALSILSSKKKTSAYVISLTVWKFIIVNGSIRE